MHPFAARQHTDALRLDGGRSCATDRRFAHGFGSAFLVGVSDGLRRVGLGGSFCREEGLTRFADVKKEPRSLNFRSSIPKISIKFGVIFRILLFLRQKYPLP